MTSVFNTFQKIRKSDKIKHRDTDTLLVEILIGRLGLFFFQIKSCYFLCNLDMYPYGKK